ncbi:ribonuclease HIII [Mycoplasmopsis edwardii]|uniref:Ribonuclease HIII n=1 Tax=Mycoplasmopsis edwardii TaxID=53558 RepID=A0ACD4PHC0_9BACT|nr:ribonuclease HIII [Mycoplasmopsis edwardii]WBP84052.1 ribonuclease HIII [Mycoplasmopsis edwardii]
MLFLDNFDFDFKNENVLGIDETGVGDYFTPVISCAAFLPKEMIEWTKEIGVKDSKLLSDQKINEIADLLIHKVPFSVYTLTQSGYNKLVDKKFNANEIKFFIHMQSILNFEKKYNFQNKKILIDQYSTTNSIKKYQDRFSFIEDFLNFYKKEKEIYLMKKAEQHSQAVACASIIARATLNNYMKKQKEEYDFNFLLGASQKVKDQVSEFEAKFGKETLSKVSKTSFKI